MNQKIFSSIILASSLMPTGCQAQIPSQNQTLQLLVSIPLPNVSGRIDHLAYDSKHQRIFVAALGNNTIEVVDLVSKKVIHTIQNLSEPQGVACVPESNSIFVANGDNGECDVYDAASYQKTASIKFSSDADNVRYDSADKKVYVGYGNAAIAVVDASTYKVVTEIKLDGHPESFQLDKQTKRMYVNVPDKQQIAVIDLEKNIVVAKWKILEAKSNFPMSLDVTNHRLFIGCRHPAKLLVMNTETGKVISSFDIDGDTDDVFYDGISKQVYVSCGGGYVDIFSQKNADTYSANGKISTHSGARTSLFIRELNQLVVASPSGFSGEATLLVYKVN